jgi:hypothetical protein
MEVMMVVKSVATARVIRAEYRPECTTVLSAMISGDEPAFQRAERRPF